jgi:DNA-binding protein HU-beta
VCLKADKLGENPKKLWESLQNRLTKRCGEPKVDCGTVRKAAWKPRQYRRFRIVLSAAGLRQARGLFSPHSISTQERRSITMAKGMTKTALVRAMAEKMELTNKQTSSFLELLAETAVKETKKNGEFTIPGIGKLVKAERKARLGRNPQTGETIKIKAKTVVKFRVAKTAQDTIAPPKK